MIKTAALTNELGHEIYFHVRQFEYDGLKQYTIKVTGPDTETSWTLTEAEYFALFDLIRATMAER